MEKTKISVNIPQKTKKIIDIIPRNNSEVIREALQMYITKKYNAEKLESIRKTIDEMDGG